MVSYHEKYLAVRAKAKAKATSKKKPAKKETPKVIPTKSKLE